MPKCPVCQTDNLDLYPIELELRDKIKKLDPTYPVGQDMCKSCIVDLRRKTLGSGGVLLAQERAKDERKKKLWHSRVALVKQGNALMASKLYNDAAVSYEKYLRLLELVFDCKTGQLNPESLKESAKTAELTVISGVYWDLLRIYDGSDQFADRQKHAAVQLAKFINYTPVFPDIMKKANVFMKSARNPDVVRLFISQAKKKRARCFIATSAFEAPNSLEVHYLRVYRDQTLKQSYWGRKFVYIYYRLSPSIADFMDKHPRLKPLVRQCLRIYLRII
ncbi:MAG: hypothetical protein K0R29_2044 [Pseudobdellovibrio sp.]|nr:hypothetical protein [Pseudobdellovibrio sp.]